MNNLRAIKLLAMAAVVSEGDEYNLRYLQRWYSREFSTPLADVMDIPVDDLLQAYFEVRYEELAGPDRKQEIEKLLETEKEHELRCREEDAREAADLEFSRRVSAAARKQPTTPISEAVSQVQGALGSLAAAVKKAQEMDKKDGDGLKASDLQPQEPPEPRVLRDISHRFDFIESDADFFDDPCGPRPKNAK